MRFVPAAPVLIGILLVTSGSEIPGTVFVDLQRRIHSSSPTSSASPHLSISRNEFSAGGSFSNDIIAHERELASKLAGHVNLSLFATLMPNPGKFDREAARQKLFQSLQLTAEQIKAFSELAQGSAEWKEARRNRFVSTAQATQRPNAMSVVIRLPCISRARLRDVSLDLAGTRSAS